MNKRIPVMVVVLVAVVPLASWAILKYREASLAEGRLGLSVSVPHPDLRVNETADSSITLQNIDNHAIRVFDSEFWALHVSYHHENGTEVRWIYHNWPAVKPPPIRDGDFRILRPGATIKFDMNSLPMEFPGGYYVQVGYTVRDYDGIALSRWKGTVFSNKALFEVAA